MYPVASELAPLPAKGLAHAVVFFPDLPKHLMGRLTKALMRDYPLLRPLDPTRWGVASSPRTVSFGELVAQTDDHGHTACWHLLIDSQGIAPEVRQAIFDRAQANDEPLLTKLDESQAAVLVFLLDDGCRPSTPMTRMHALSYPVWRLLELGASGVAFPEGGTILSSGTLGLLEAQNLGAGHSYLFVSNGVAHRAEDKLWFRTYGMAQFGLPDLCHSVLNDPGDEFEEELTRTRLVFETLPPEMIAVGGVLPLGGAVTVGDRVFRAAALPDDAPPMASRYGLCYLE